MIVEKYGADTLRLYEMFLGPINQSKPWDSNGIDGSFRFLRKAWNLFWTKDGQLAVTDTEREALEAEWAKQDAAEIAVYGSCLSPVNESKGDKKP